MLLETWREAIATLGAPSSLVIGGKSMGARMASLLADEAGVAALVALGFPFHAPGRPPGGRIGHLAGIRTPSLFVQGTRDAFGGREEVSGYALSDAIAFHWIEDGDHDLAPRKKSGLSREAAMTGALDAVARFARAAIRGPRRRGG